MGYNPRLAKYRTHSQTCKLTTWPCHTLTHTHTHMHTHTHTHTHAHTQTHTHTHTYSGSYEPLGTTHSLKTLGTLRPSGTLGTRGSRGSSNSLISLWSRLSCLSLCSRRALQATQNIQVSINTSPIEAQVQVSYGTCGVRENRFREVHVPVNMPHNPSLHIPGLPLLQVVLGTRHHPQGQWGQQVLVLRGVRGVPEVHGDQELHWVLCCHVLPGGGGGGGGDNW